MDKDLAQIIIELEAIVKELAECLRTLTVEQLKISSQVNFIWKELSAEDLKIDKSKLV